MRITIIIIINDVNDDKFMFAVGFLFGFSLQMKVDFGWSGFAVCGTVCAVYAVCVCCVYCVCSEALDFPQRFAQHRHVSMQ